MRIALEVGWVPQREHGRRHPGPPKVARRHPAVASVVTGAAEDEHGAVSLPQGARPFGYGAAGVLHEHDAGYPQRFNGPSIGGTRVLGPKER